MKTIYIAGPYSKGDVAVNVRNSILLQSRLYDVGLRVYNPLLTHFIHMMEPRLYEFWLDDDMFWLAKCDALVRLPGESLGAEREIATAEKLGIPVYRIQLHDVAEQDELYEWLFENGAIQSNVQKP